MSERSKFAYDRDYYNKIAAEYIRGSLAKRNASAEPKDEYELEEYLTATYAPEYKDSVTQLTKEMRKRSESADRIVRDTVQIRIAREKGMSSARVTHTNKTNSARPANKSFSGAALPAVTPVREEQQAPPVIGVKTRYKIRINAVKIIVFGVLLFMVAQFSMNLLNAKSNVNRVEKAIASAKIKLEDVNSYNESLLGQLDISYDRNYIYNVAVGKLGMVYPKDNAIVYYKAADTGHVIQYRDIS